MKEILDDLDYQKPRKKSKYLKNMKRNILITLIYLPPSLLVMTLTKNASEFGKMIGTSENFAFVSIIIMVITGAIFFIIVIYRTIRYIIERVRLGRI